MSFLTRCVIDATRSPFSFLGQDSYIVSYSYSYTITGAVRAATKRAGGTVHNHGGSPGKRLGVKKFSGWFRIVLTTASNDLLYHRSVCYPWKHHRQTTRHTIPSRTTCTSSFTWFIHLPIVFMTG
jgi:hypothetical protein